MTARCHKRRDFISDSFEVSKLCIIIELFFDQLNVRLRNQTLNRFFLLSGDFVNFGVHFKMNLINLLVQLV